MNYALLIPIISNFILNFLVKKKVINYNSTYGNIILTAVLIIVIATKYIKDEDTRYAEESSEENTIDENMAYAYPLILSIFLLLIYVIIKYSGSYKDIILKILFFASITTSLINIIPINKYIIIALVLLYFIVDHNTKGKYPETKLYLNNLIAILIAISSMKIMNINNVKTSIILLVGLFLFDIFWVFGSKKIFDSFSNSDVNKFNSKKVSVMETVASNVDAPILLKYFADRGTPMILGLGDIIIPGLFIKTLFSLENKAYYNTSIITYIFGLVSALYASLTFKQGQPALLYIVPAVIIPTVIRAYFSGENIFK